MTTRERERLGLALAVSLVVHVIAFVIVEFGDWRVAPLPEFSGPLYVEVEPLPETRREGLAETPPTPESTAEGTSPAAAEAPARESPAPETQARQTPGTTPADEPPAAASTAQEQAPRAEPPAQQQGEAAEEPAPQASARDPLAGERQTREYSLEDIYERDTTPGAAQAPPADEEFQRLPETGDTQPDVELPDWATQPRQTVEEAGISTEGVSEGEVEDLAEKVATDPEFARTMREVTRALEESTDGDGRPDAGEQAGPQQPEPEAAPREGTPGDARFDWVGTGDRGLLNPPAVSEGFFTSRDFGGSVPARTTFVVVFEVNRRGNVVPGSVIFQQGSEHVVAREKLRSRVREWVFEPAGTAEVATGIFTLVVRREDIR